MRNHNLDPTIEEQINNLLIEILEEDTKNASSEENLNLIQQDDQSSFTDDEDTQEINTLTREHDLLFEAINSIPDPEEKKVFLDKLRKSLETKPRPKDFIKNNKFVTFLHFRKLKFVNDLHRNENNYLKKIN